MISFVYSLVHFTNQSHQVFGCEMGGLLLLFWSTLVLFSY